MFVPNKLFDYKKGIINSKIIKCDKNINKANHAVLAVGFKIDLNKP